LSFLVTMVVVRRFKFKSFNRQFLCYAFFQVFLRDFSPYSVTKEKMKKPWRKESAQNLFPATPVLIFGRQGCCPLLFPLLLLLDLGPRVAKRHCPVEYQFVFSGILINIKVSFSHKLVSFPGFRFRQARFQLASGQDLQ